MGTKGDERMKIKKMMFVTKFEDLGYDAIQSLLSLRKASLEHIVFMNVIERDKVAMQRGVGYKKEDAVRLKETANIRFIDWAERLFEQGMEVGVYIQVGSLVGEVAKAAQKEEADLVVIGRTHKTAMEQFYSGSTVIELIRRVSIPVLVYKPVTDSPFAMGQPFERPLVATDWSPASLRAIDYLLDLKALIKDVRVVHVADEKQIEGASVMRAQKTYKDTKTRLDEICARFQSEGIAARPHVYVGNPAVEIEKAARECQATIVVTGSSAKMGWVERFIGSTPREIAEKSVFPTLLIPPERRERPAA
jgi:nucleotide-binding universal stress UspA family protein